jgi:hypothetical protein
VNKEGRRERGRKGGRRKEGQRRERKKERNGPHLSLNDYSVNPIS